VTTAFHPRHRSRSIVLRATSVGAAPGPAASGDTRPIPRFGALHPTEIGA
jgi:hypothetical protein